MNNSIPRHENHYQTDPKGRYVIMDVRKHEGKTYRSIMPSPRFSDVKEARRYAGDWNEFNQTIQYVVCEVG